MGFSPRSRTRRLRSLPRVRPPAFDFRTGKPTAIIGPDVNDGIRAACHALNLGRKSGIAAAIGGTPPRREVPNDVWIGRFVASLGALDIPLIDLEAFGFHHEEGFLGNRHLKALLTARREPGWLDAACGEARVFRETGTRLPRWDETVDDGEL